MSVTREALLESWKQPSFWQRLNVWDGVWALLVVMGSVYAWWLYRSYMDGYEVAIQFGSNAGADRLGTSTGSQRGCLLWR